MRTVSPGRVATLLRPALLGPGPAYDALARGLRDMVSDGRLPVGARIPSERLLAAELGMSRTTVTRAYDALREHAYLESRRGSGSVTRLPLSRAGRTDHLLMPRGSSDDSIDLTIATRGAPPGTAAAFASAVQDLPAYLAGTGYFPTGLPALREAVAERFDARGMPTDPAQVVIVAGALAGLAVAAQVVAQPGDTVLLEAPTYPNPISTLHSRRLRLLGIPVDPEAGWDVETMRGPARAPRTRAAYLIPDFQNPTGALMSDEARAEVAALLRSAHVTAVVDESLVDTRLDHGPMPLPFAAHDPSALTLGSASKGFWGGLRIGWVRAPSAQVAAVTAARLSLDLSSPLVEQLALLHLFREEDQVRVHQRAQLLASRAALLAALAEHLPSWRTTPGRGGLSLWCRLPEPLSSALSVAAERHGVYVPAGPSFAPEGGLEHHVRLPHTLPPDTLVEAVRRLARAWAEAPGEDRRTSGRAPFVA